MDALARHADDLLLKLERALILLAVTGMTVLVGLDVVQRTFSRPVGKTQELLVWLGGKVAGPLSEQTRASLEGNAGDAFFGVLACLFLVAATHASRRTRAVRNNLPAPDGVRSWVMGVVLFGALFAAVRALLWAFPSSVPGAQKFALALMLWSGMLGASVATREKRHIMLDAVTKKLTGSTQRGFLLLSGLVTALLCAGLAALGGLQLAGEIQAWSAHEGVGLYEAVPLPTWIGTLAIPVSFLGMALRFGGYAIRDFRFGPSADGDGGHGVNLAELEKEAVVLEAQGPTS